MDTYEASTSGEESSHDEVCAVCGRYGTLLCCETCTRVYHGKCLSPPLNETPEGVWVCPQCFLTKKCGVCNVRKCDVHCTICGAVFHNSCIDMSNGQSAEGYVCGKCACKIRDIRVDLVITDSALLPLYSAKRKLLFSELYQENRLPRLGSKLLVKIVGKSLLHSRWVMTKQIRTAYPEKVEAYLRLRQMLGVGKSALLFDASWVQIGRVVGHQADIVDDDANEGEKYLVKWSSFSYSGCTWETRGSLIESAQLQRKILEGFSDCLSEDEIIAEFDRIDTRRELAKELAISEDEMSSESSEDSQSSDSSMETSEEEEEPNKGTQRPAQSKSKIATARSNVGDGSGAKSAKSALKGKYSKLGKENLSKFLDKECVYLGDKQEDMIRQVLAGYERNQHSMIISGPPSSGKVFALMKMLQFLYSKDEAGCALIVVMELERLNNWAKRLRKEIFRGEALVFSGSADSIAAIKRYEFGIPMPKMNFQQQDLNLRYLITMGATFEDQYGTIMKIAGRDGFGIAIVDDSQRRDKELDIQDADHVEDIDVDIPDALFGMLLVVSDIESPLVAAKRYENLLLSSTANEPETKRIKTGDEEDINLDDLDLTREHDLYRFGRLYKSLVSLWPYPDEEPYQDVHIMMCSQTEMENALSLSIEATYRSTASRAREERDPGRTAGGEVKYAVNGATEGVYGISVFIPKRFMLVLNELKLLCNHPLLLLSESRSNMTSLAEDSIIGSAKLAVLDKFLRGLPVITDYSVIVVYRNPQIFHLLKAYLKLRSNFIDIEHPVPADTTAISDIDIVFDGIEEFDKRVRCFLLSEQQFYLARMRMACCVKVKAVILYDWSWSRKEMATFIYSFRELYRSWKLQRIASQKKPHPPKIPVYILTVKSSVEELSVPFFNFGGYSFEKSVGDDDVEAGPTGRYKLRKKAKTEPQSVAFYHLVDSINSRLKEGGEKLVWNAEGEVEEGPSIHHSDDFLDSIAGTFGLSLDALNCVEKNLHEFLPVKNQEEYLLNFENYKPQFNKILQRMLRKERSVYEKKSSSEIGPHQILSTIIFMQLLRNKLKEVFEARVVMAEEPASKIVQRTMEILYFDAKRCGIFSLRANSWLKGDIWSIDNDLTLLVLVLRHGYGNWNDIYTDTFRSLLSRHRNESGGHLTRRARNSNIRAEIPKNSLSVALFTLLCLIGEEFDDPYQRVERISMEDILQTAITSGKKRKGRKEELLSEYKKRPVFFEHGVKMLITLRVEILRDCMEVGLQLYELPHSFISTTVNRVYSKYLPQ